MSGEESGADCFSTVSCDLAEYYLCKRKDQCLEAAENLESMIGAVGKAGVPFRVFVEWRKDRWGLSSMALKEMRAALNRVPTLEMAKKMGRNFRDDDFNSELIKKEDIK